MANQKQKRVIIILAVLLIISLIALAGVLIYHRWGEKPDATVTVPDNLITPDKNKDEDTETSENGSAGQNNPPATAEKSDNAGSVTQNKKQATAITLCNKQPQDNTAFTVGNLFPGDYETKYYRTQVSYHDKVTVHFKINVRKSYEKLAEVLKIKVTLLNNDEVMYEGVIKDMPDSVTHPLASPNSTTDALYYEITAYLDTSVGNEYQNQDLIADFQWWVEETGNLEQAPQTGDISCVILWLIIAITSATLCIVLLVFHRKKEDVQNGK